MPGCRLTKGIRKQGGRDWHAPRHHTVLFQFLFHINIYEIIHTQSRQ